jgi:serine/threonine protein kinase
MFTRHEVLGEGEYASVFRATHRRTKKSFAIKEVSQCSDEIQNEIQMLKIVSSGCPYIVQMHDAFEEGDHSYLVMDEMKGGDLLTRITQKECYSEIEARQVCRYLLEAVDYCHQHHVAHRDLKPENLLLVEKDNDVKIKLSDFGLAAVVDKPNSLTALCGTTEYTAPEVFAGNGYDQRADMWSVGVILYILLGGYAPFDGPLDELLHAIQHGLFKFHDDYWSNISSSAKSMIRSLLTVDPAQRMTAREALNCDWMNPGRDENTRKRSIQALIRNYERCSSKKSGSNSKINESTSSLLDVLTNSSSSSHLRCESLTNSSRRNGSPFVRPVRSQR